MRAEILTIGDELLRGEIIDSNKSFLSEQLLTLDIETRHHVSVRDDPSDMIDTFRRAAERSDVVLVSGGLGPTRDDLTSQVLAKAFGREHRLDEAALETIRAFFRSIGREMTDNNASQAYFPDGAEVLPNPIGTAPGFLVEEGGTLFFCMPGVPRELERMLREQVLPRIAARRGDGQVVRSALLRTFGMGESTLDDELVDIAASGDVSLGFRTSFRTTTCAPWPGPRTPSRPRRSSPRCATRSTSAWVRWSTARARRRSRRWWAGCCANRVARSPPPSRAPAV